MHDVTGYDVTGRSIAQLRHALETGQITATGLAEAYLARIARFDRVDPTRADGRAADGGVPLNSVVVMNPDALAEAAASDDRRARGAVLGPLDGIPYTAKESYMVRGLPVPAGSPAFADLIAQWDAFTIERLRAGGAILLGLTTMPPMANGGMQRGVHGRAESPYNSAFLTSAFASGSSNGSGTATAAELAAFGLAEETWSSGRAPASCNSLCAYTPSRGVISVRGNWPLVPTMDVVVPHTRSMSDMLDVLDVIVADDRTARGDFWRVQPWIEIPAASAVRPPSYPDLPRAADALAGVRLGVPRMYINEDADAGTGGDRTSDTGVGGPMGRRIETTPAVLDLWNALRADLEAAGALVVDVDFPLISNYEGDRPAAPTISTRGLVDAEYLETEVGPLAAWAWEDFLQANGDPQLGSLREVDGATIFPHPDGTLPDRYDGFSDDLALYPQYVRDWDRLEPPALASAFPPLADGLRGLERTRQIDLEEWMDRLGLDALVFPAMAGVGPADADTDPGAADLAWRNGVWVANGNLALRHCGIPTVTVPMGAMKDCGMPVGVTLAGRAWDDNRLLTLAAAVESTTASGTRRVVPPRVCGAVR
ncbi:Amidase OS=Tsukamurella paurometabola (strain ATCC 8368 / DSM / CCUG 35730 / CIP 100753 / JCM 10117 / KCTC 9821 / NBRC 16120 / NCIMB 702349 / NCTC 13040)OX=521096 GN=Tpau_0680 PE=4 SV=1 [Tsukamurella paurometabola]|uniref:Amidase n=1 Tax=Tsukamurella paurometabola (strain ATCC 8368 / DSM 20162 / CCUG 35730 / CIP 100753 / JCM 10117 / KCTC 9821 / NBRC 16120 / NCIMB 702349 / NCTC 13040) TaxID=521096 RepID=D5UT30_TSUPD|nr:amidase [Tsukamurella paurometabola]ADG77317.1 Amidase [Tsukamurella paurometabola DSM 20162]SUP43474.1 Mandelamide hydrolase [Tsukamurella paurometabola]